jgi:uncharacterized protein YceK
MLWTHLTIWLLVVVLAVSVVLGGCSMVTWDGQSESIQGRIIAISDQGGSHLKITNDALEVHTEN